MVVVILLEIGSSDDEALPLVNISSHPVVLRVRKGALVNMVMNGDNYDDSGDDGNDHDDGDDNGDGGNDSDGNNDDEAPLVVIEYLYMVTLIIW